MKHIEMGMLLTTASVSERMADPEFARFVRNSLVRYANCDWGELDDEDAEMNDLALKNGDDRIIASYEHPEHPKYKIWILTEWDHRATTILFPDEY